MCIFVTIKLYCSRFISYRKLEIDTHNYKILKNKSFFFQKCKAKNSVKPNKNVNLAENRI